MVQLFDGQRGRQIISPIRDIGEDSGYIDTSACESIARADHSAQADAPGKVAIELLFDLPTTRITPRLTASELVSSFAARLNSGSETVLGSGLSSRYSSPYQAREALDLAARSSLLSWAQAVRGVFVAFSITSFSSSFTRLVKREQRFTMEDMENRHPYQGNIIWAVVRISWGAMSYSYAGSIIGTTLGK